MKTSILFLAILFYASSSTALETSTQEELSLAYTLSKAGKHADAILRVQPLLNALKLDTIESIVLGNKILAVSYCELEDREKAKEHFETLKAFQPDESLKEFTLSSSCADFFGIKKNPPKKPKTVELENAPPVAIPDHLKPKESSWKLYAPFGTGQFHNGQRDKGWAFLATQTVGLLAAGTMYVLFQSEKNKDGTFPKPGLANAYKKTYWSALGVAGASSIWGVIDALVVHKKNQK